MKRVFTTIDSFEQVADEFDKAALRLGTDYSPFCSASDWSIAGHRALKPERSIEIREIEGYWLAFSKGALSSFQRAYQPLEFDWGFGSPLIGPDPRVGVEILGEFLHEAKDWEIAILTGVPKHGALQEECLRKLSHQFGVQTYDGCHCLFSSVQANQDLFLADRSKKFRTNLRRSLRQAKEQSITFELVSSTENPKELFQRMFEVEKKSWKYKDKASIYLNPRYKAFYYYLLSSLLPKGRFRIVFAKLGDRDIGYVMGGILGSFYRGFQLGYDDEFAKLGVGNLLQWELMNHLRTEGVLYYDLGMEMTYKRRWGNNHLELTNIVIFQ